MPDFSLIAALIGGLVILAFAGDFLVSGAVAVAERFGVSKLIAGIFIVGFGTSAPEMVVSLNAALEDRAGLALGNIVGSNIANIFLVLGIPALIMPFVAEQPAVEPDLSHDPRLLATASMAGSWVGKI